MSADTRTGARSTDRLRSGLSLARTPADTLRRLVDASIDRGLAVRTAGFVDATPAGDAGQERVWYEPSGWLPVFRALRGLGVRQDDVLLEYGAGKGRVLAVAKSFSFARVIGLEVSADLAAAARDTLVRVRTPTRCERVTIEVGDAATWDVPDDVSVVYMYCPFTGGVFKSAIRSLLASVDRTKRRVRLVYTNPYEHNFLLATDRFMPVAVLPAIWPAPWDWYAQRLVGRSRPSRSWEDRKVTVTYEVVPSIGASNQSPDIGSWSGFRPTNHLLPARFSPVMAAPQRQDK